ncbi:YdiU family protein [Phenylobacterium sp. J426]|uniref:protein adenylyltransferase SelO n=1 Tax=Phenylobacterium sp. J426 TaxID=2898439 RepID=UPI00215181C4|nr:YdiU family protein [Phenylobacterium sp. J426]MCR5873224.1 YdiU family protein [Phenylobacterium sp. J426]
MPVSAAYRPDPKFPELGSEFADPVAAAHFPKTILRYRNDRAAATVGLDALTDEEWIAHFGRFHPLPGNIDPPLAQRYHGHQFRVYNPELGDGRGFTFAQVRELGTDRLLELGTKGSGQTPWSRSGDGRLTLKGGVREVLATAMLEALGVPTSRSFSLVETGEDLIRGDEPSPTRSSVLVRLSHSHIRFGTFQRHAFFERADRIAALVDHVIANYYPELEGADDRPAALLAAVGERAARLAASWMAAGFVHGVLNTDNMNITGESFDYGPYRFLPKSDPNFTAAYFDHAGLYAFGRQPEAVFWNLQQLAGCLTFVSDSDRLVEALNGFGPAYRRELVAAVIRRLGLQPRGEGPDDLLVQAAFKNLAEGGERLRWEPFFFDWFCQREPTGPRADIYSGEAFADFRDLIRAYAPDRPERLAHPYFAGREPEELLYDEIEAIWAPIAAADDWEPLEAKLFKIEAARQAWGFSP